MNAETIALALGGRRSGSHWMALYPAHEDREPSLSLKDADAGKTLVYCHAGCDQALVISELRSRGLWDDARDNHRLVISKSSPEVLRVVATPDCGDRTTVALRLWRSAAPAPETPVEAYLRSRGIDIAAPPSIRFHPQLKHPTGGVWPGLVALVTRGPDAQPLAIHRTFLAHDGTGKAPVSPQKMMLGPCRGGVVRLAAQSGMLMVGEGIETCLATMQATGSPAWAALSTSGLRSLELPTEIREVIILADGDDPGEAAAVDAAKRWKREGRAVRIARPPTGLDFNDVLLGSHAVEQEGAV